MTYIFDMASGSEHQGDAMLCPQSQTTTASAVPMDRAPDHQVELRLALVATESAAEQSRTPPQGLDLAALIDSLD